MRVLYINNFTDGTGWSKQGIDSILALDSVGIDVVPRAIKLNNITTQVPDRIKELETKSDKNPDIVIQNVLPTFVKYFGGVKNIIYYQTETESFKNIGWSDEINLMDEAWVSCKFAAGAAKHSGVKIPIKLVPMPVNCNKFLTTYNKNVFGIRNEIGDSFVFYTISEFTKRKNIETLIKAFHSEFYPEEQVYLLIKTTNPSNGVNIQDYINDIKKNLGIYNDISQYKRDLIIAGNISQEDVYSIHQTCDAFVTASRGEGWCIPAFDAMGFGKTLVVPGHSAFTDYLDDNSAYLVNCYIDNCYGALDAIPGLYSANDTWFEVPVIELRKKMRQAYEQRNGAAKKKAEICKKNIANYSYQKIGTIMKNLLEK